MESDSTTRYLHDATFDHSLFVTWYVDYLLAFMGICLFIISLYTHSL